MFIGTARPTAEELKGVKHYFIGSHSIHDELTSGRYCQEAEKILTDQFKEREIVLLTGGSGMYIDALCKGLDNVPVSEQHRQLLTEEWQKDGLSSLLKELELKDPEHFARIDKNNPMRVIRALEVVRLTGKTYSSFLGKTSKTPDFEIIRFRIEHLRENLYTRINERVDAMMDAGLLEETKNLYSLRHLNALRTVGYSELFDFHEGKTDLTRAVALIKQHTRNYAKRQETWFRRNPESMAIPFSSFDQMKKAVLDAVNSRFS
jgi:tRNA dimethylallyltransferase